MPTKDEKIRVLKMIEEGKISADQGIELLNALDASSTAKNPGSAGFAPHMAQHPQWLRITVTDIDSGKRRVNVRMPAALISTGTKMGAHFSTSIDSINPDQLREYVRSGKFGRIVDVIDEDDHEHVEIFLE